MNYARVSTFFDVGMLRITSCAVMDNIASGENATRASIRVKNESGFEYLKGLFLDNPDFIILPGLHLKMLQMDRDKIELELQNGNGIFYFEFITIIN